MLISRKAIHFAVREMGPNFFVHQQVQGCREMAWVYPYTDLFHLWDLRVFSADFDFKFGWSLQNSIPSFIEKSSKFTLPVQ